MDQRHQRGLRQLVLVIDAFIIVVAMGLAASLHVGLRAVVPFLKEPPSFDHYAALPYLVLPTFLYLIAAFGLHRSFERVWSRAGLLVDLAKLHLAVFLSLAVLLFLSRSIINRSLTALFLGCTFALLYVERRSISRWRRFQHARGIGRQRLLLIGPVSSALESFLRTASAAALPPHFVGRLSTGELAGAQRNDALPAVVRAVPVLGRPEDLAHVLHVEAVDQVLFFAPQHHPEEMVAALDECELRGIPASFQVEMPRPLLSAPRIVTQFDAPFISFETAPKSAATLAVKHGVDVFAAALGLLLLSPLLLLCAVAIALTMGQPIFFIQERAGLYGRRFRMLKFRTMVADAEQRKEQLQQFNEMSGPVFKIARDPRVTRLGRLLRRTSIDELPQLLNVVSGSMSLVGPRPLPVREQEAIRGWHRRRLSMKPGLTGLWQVSGRNTIDFEDWMRLDLEYIDRWSLGLDAHILLRTVPAVLSVRGAR